MRALLVVLVFFALGHSATVLGSSSSNLPSQTEKILWIIDVSQGLTDVTVTVDNPVGAVLFSLKDSQGRVVYSAKETGNNIIKVIDTTSFASGTYTLEVKDDENLSETTINIEN